MTLYEAKVLLGEAESSGRECCGQECCGRELRGVKSDVVV